MSAMIQPREYLVLHSTYMQLIYVARGAKQNTYQNSKSRVHNNDLIGGTTTFPGL